MWSLIDGITNDENYNYCDTASPSQQITNPEGNLQTPDQLVKSPSNMLISTLPKNNDDTDCNDDDDQLSLTSYGMYGKRPSPDPVPMPVSTPTSTDRPSRTVEDIASTPNSQPFTDSHSESQDSDTANAKHLARQGISARKKKARASTTSNIGSTAASSSVRKALGQLAACRTSHKDDEQDDFDLTPAPSDEVTSENVTPTSDTENGRNAGPHRGFSSSTGNSRTTGSNLALREVNHQRLLGGNGDDSSVENSKNSSLRPDKLFNDTTLKSESSYLVEQPKKKNGSNALDTSALVKDRNGNYVIDSMASF
jgi:hypothetical protein